MGTVMFLNKNIFILVYIVSCIYIYTHTDTDGRHSHQGFFQGGGAFSPPPPLGTGRFVNGNSSLMYG